MTSALKSFLSNYVISRKVVGFSRNIVRRFLLSTSIQIWSYMHLSIANYVLTLPQARGGGGVGVIFIVITLKPCRYGAEIHSTFLTFIWDHLENNLFSKWRLFWVMRSFFWKGRKKFFFSNPSYFGSYRFIYDLDHKNFHLSWYWYFLCLILPF